MKTPTHRTTCLKYLVLANMLTQSAINPFDSQEAKPFKNNPEIIAMTNLVSLVTTFNKHSWASGFYALIFIPEVPGSNPGLR